MTKPHDNGEPTSPLIIERQGSFFVGGRTIKAAGVFDPETMDILGGDHGQSFHIDQTYVAFQIPPQARDLPILMIHGAGQTGKTWESTPDGREGYQSVFVRRGFPVYIADFARRGKSGFPSFSGPAGTLLSPQVSGRGARRYSRHDANVYAPTQVVAGATSRYGNESAFVLFRNGPHYGDYFENSQFPRDAIDQFNKWIVPFFPDDPEVVTDGIAAVCEEIGPCILLTHSQSGLFGWLSALKSANVKAIISYEPGECVFPAGQLPAIPPLYDGAVFPCAVGVPESEFKKLTKVHIQLVYGDNIPQRPVPNAGLDLWRAVTSVAKHFVDAVNRAGGDAEYLDLPAAGIPGNTHFPFADLNSMEIADLLSKYLADKRLDRRSGKGHAGR